MASISTHNGSKGKIEHNVRDEKFIANEMAKQLREKGTQHIRTDGEHEVWRNQDLREVYKEEFQESVDAYNAKQTREDRKIDDYYQKICDDKKKHPFYEMIVGVYGGDVSPEVGKAIVKEFFDGWDERNPNLKLFSCSWHNDEQNKNLNGHGHFDYLPIAHNCKTGPKKATALNGALAEMGFVDKGKLTAQMQWQARENKVLEEICIKHSIVVERPKEKREHQEKETYILEQRAKEASQTLSEALTGIENAKSVRDGIDAEIVEKEALRDSLSSAIGESADSIQQLSDDIRHAINSSKKEPIERLSEKSQIKIFGKEIRPSTTTVKTTQLDALEKSPGLTPSNCWQLDKLEQGLREVSATLDKSREQELSDRVRELEEENRSLRQINKSIENKFQLLKDWAIEIIEKELSLRGIARKLVQSITQRVQKSFSSIEKTSLEMNHEFEEREL